LNLTILYRGPLRSCNYACAYCPFAKACATAAEDAADRVALARFVNWAGERHVEQLSVFFTPWGEALTHGRYQRAIARLGWMPHVARVAIQTNLSGRLDWLDDCDTRRVGLWTTYHPGQVARAQFLAQCAELDRRGVRYSVGVVGLLEHIDEIEAMRAALPPHVYLWVNAYKHAPDYYDAQRLRRITAVDPLFPLNTHRYPSLGEACRCGSSVISVDGAGTMRRCHFIAEPIGSLYVPGFLRALRERPCTAATCHCHIGYVHMDRLGLYEVFGEGVLERIPVRRPPGV
jgi:hypothetical protein